MSWSINTSGIPGIDTLKNARETWEAAKFWKGRDENVRQLNGPRKKHMTIVKTAEGFSCRLYHTDLVEYLNNGNVVLRCHDSQSSTFFAWCVAPFGCRPITMSGRMFWEVKTADGTHYYRQGEEPLEFTPDGMGWKIISSPEIQKEWVFDPKLGAATRKKLKPYKVWHDVSVKLGMSPTRSWRRYAKDTISLLLYESDEVTFSDLFCNAGSPAEIYPIAYEITGARYKADVPFDRLPRSFA